jgi:hypothetical protein
VNRYTFRALAWDYGRAVLGLAIVGMILTSLEIGRGMFWVMASLEIAFALFLAHTLSQQFQTFAWDETGVRRTLFGRVREIAWPSLTQLEMRYWGSRRKKDGTLNLALSDGRTRLSIDDHLPDFADIVSTAVRAAQKKALALDPITQDNLAALGHAAQGGEYHGSVARRPRP